MEDKKKINIGSIEVTEEVFHIIRNSIDPDTMGSDNENVIEGIEDNDSLLRAAASSPITGTVDVISNIQTKLTPYNYNDKNDTSRIQYIVIHYVGAVSTAANNADYFYNAYREASAHYFVDETSIWRVVEDGDIAWHCGTKGKYYHPTCRNTNSIGIEMCVKKTNGEWYFEPETVINTIKLVKMLMEKYNIPVDNIIRHYDVTGKICPEPYVRDEELWDEFKKALVTEEETTSNTGSAEPIYNNLDEVPSWAKDTINKLIEKGYLRGQGIKGTSELNLTYSMIRTLVILDRAGQFDN